jgi:hypothetical protein
MGAFAPRTSTICCLAYEIGQIGEPPGSAAKARRVKPAQPGHAQKSPAWKSEGKMVIIGDKPTQSESDERRLSFQHNGYFRVLIDTPNNSEKVMPFNSESDSLGISGLAAPGGYRFRETAP